MFRSLTKHLKRFTQDSSPTNEYEIQRGLRDEMGLYTNVNHSGVDFTNDTEIYLTHDDQSHNVSNTYGNTNTSRQQYNNQREDCVYDYDGMEGYDDTSGRYHSNFNTAAANDLTIGSTNLPGKSTRNGNDSFKVNFSYDGHNGYRYLFDPKSSSKETVFESGLAQSIPSRQVRSHSPKKTSKDSTNESHSKQIPVMSINRRSTRQVYSKADHTHDNNPGPVNMDTLRGLSFKPRDEQNMPFDDKVMKWLNGVCVGSFTVVERFDSSGNAYMKPLKPYPTTCSEPSSDDGNGVDEDGDKAINCAGDYGYNFGKCFDDDISEASEDGKQERTCRRVTRDVVNGYRAEIEKHKAPISMVPNSLRSSPQGNPNNHNSRIRIKVGTFRTKVMKSDGLSPSSTNRKANTYKNDHAANGDAADNDIEIESSYILPGASEYPESTYQKYKSNYEGYDSSRASFKKRSESSINRDGTQKHYSKPDRKQYYSTELGGNPRKHHES